MEPLSTKLRRLGAFVEGAQQAGLKHRLHLGMIRRDVLTRAAEARRRREQGRWALATVSLAATVAFLVLITWISQRKKEAPAAQATAISYRVTEDGTPASVGRFIRTTERTGARLAFSEGTTIDAAQSTAVRVVHTDGSGARVVLESGALAVAVQPRPGARWSFNSGPFETKVLGTVFSIHWEPSTQRFSAEVTRGKVRVDGPVVGRRVLFKGQRLRVDLEAGTLELDAAPAPTVPRAAPSLAVDEIATPPSGAAATEPLRPRTRKRSTRTELAPPSRAQAPARGGATRRAGDPDSTNDRDAAPATMALAVGPTAPVPDSLAPAAVERQAPVLAPPLSSPAPPVPSPNSSTPAPPSPRPTTPKASSSTAAAPTRPSSKPVTRLPAARPQHPEVAATWRGDCKELFADDWRRAYEHAAPLAVLKLADAARLCRDYPLADAGYRVVRRRATGTRAAAQAAFELGRLAFDQHADYRRAARDFERFLGEQPQSPLAREGLGRLLEALVRAGDVDPARERAREYLTRYPQGPHAAIARAALGPW